MAVPTSRSTFKEYCLRNLGKPVIEINVDDDQVDDRIDEALRYFWDYHFDGAEKTYYKHQITTDDIANRFITLPENVIGAVRIFELSGLYSGRDGLFDVRYQISMQELFTFANYSLIPYFMAFQHLQNVEQMLIGRQPIRYNRHGNKLYIDTAWDQFQVGEFLCVEAYQIIDPDVYTDAWADRWLLRYATALIKKQWGTNMKKFQGMKLPGGVEMNGQKIYDEAVDEIASYEKEMMVSYSLPASDLIG